jgi:Polyketide cyclase / dehydrase and lipid transport
METQYSFVTNWEIEASLQEVWNAIYNSPEWPQWWKGVVSVEEIEKEDVNGLNSVKAYIWKSVLPYKLAFTMRLTEKEPMRRLKGIAFGELEGEGEWTFSEQNRIIKLQYNWNVYTKKAWMNYLSFVLKPVFKYNHNVVMHWGAVGLAKKLNAKLLKG